MTLDDKTAEDIWNSLKSALQKILTKEDSGPIFREELYR